MVPGVDYSKWKDIPEVDEEAAPVRCDELAEGVEQCLQATYASELPQDDPRDRLHELKVKIAVDAYERRRPTGKIMHHYCVKEAGDPEAVGEYFPTGDARNDCPVYRNQRGLIISRERQPLGPDTEAECFGWVIGNMAERRPLYGVQTDDLSIPTLGWQAFTAPEPLPTIRYYTHTSAARVFKERGNRAFQERRWAEAEDWYGKSLGCGLDPSEHAEVYALLLSNRAETRLRQCNFEGAAQDADNAMKCLKNVGEEDPMQLLRQKTVVRLAKAFQTLKRFPEAHQLLQEQRRLLPKGAELERLGEEVQLALEVGGHGAPASRAGASKEMLSYVAQTIEAIQAQCDALKTEVSAPVFPQPLALALRKLEYILAKAQPLKSGCLAELQAVVRSCGGLRTLLQIAQAQWKSNLDGKLVDTFKLPAVAAVAEVVSLACAACHENVRLAAVEAPVFFSVLGGCNRKVKSLTCERLVSLVVNFWEQCRHRTMDLVQNHSIVVERVAGFLSNAAIAEPSDGAVGVDAPCLSETAKEQAVALLSELVGSGGRIEKRVLRGALGQLAGDEGDGLFTSDLPSARLLGELLARKAVADPSLLSVMDVRNLLLGVNLLVVSGPCAQAPAEETVLVSYEKYSGPGAVVRYVPLGEWADTEDGQHASLMLHAVSKTLEHRLLLKGRELERAGFENAFHQGFGFFVITPLVEGPPAFAEHALLCLAVLAQTSLDNINHIVHLQAIHALIGLPTPGNSPVLSNLDQTLKTSPACRRHAAKLLSRCVESQAVMDLLSTAGESSIKRLVKLATQVREDGQGNLESFHDMLHVFYVISQSKPGPLCRYLPRDMVHLLLDLAMVSDQSGPTPVVERAQAIVQMLLQDPACKRKVDPMIQKRQEGTVYDAEEELLSVEPQWPMT